MKKTVAILMAVVMMLALTATAYAETGAYMEWNEEEQMYMISVFEVDDGPALNPNPQYEDYEQSIKSLPDFPCMIDWRDY